MLYFCQDFGSDCSQWNSVCYDTSRMLVAHLSMQTYIYTIFISILRMILASAHSVECYSGSSKICTGHFSC